MSFEAYDDRGVVDAPSRRVPNRAMAQGAEADVRGTPARDASAFERWDVEKANTRARSPSHSDRRRWQEREYRDDPRAGSALAAATRRAVTAAGDTALAPVNMFRDEPLSTADAYAQAESLARDEPVAATRERHRVQDAAHPYAGMVGEGGGRMLSIAGAAETMKGGLRLRALGGVKGKPPTGPRDEHGGARIDSPEGRLKRMRSEYDVYAAEERARVGSAADDYLPGDVPTHKQALERLSEDVSSALAGPRDTLGQVTDQMARGFIPQDPAIRNAERLLSRAYEADYSQQVVLIDKAREKLRSSSRPWLADELPEFDAPSPRGLLSDDRGFAEWRANKVDSEAEKVLGTPRPDAQRLVGSPRFASGGELKIGRDGRGVEARAIADEGEAVSTFRRDGQGRLVVEDNYLEVPELARQEGQGREIMANKLREYDRLGADRVQFEADFDGRYVWPHLGYQVDKPTLKALEKRFNEHLESVGEEPIRARRIQDISEHPEGKDFLLDGYTEPFQMHLDLGSREADALRKRLGVPSNRRSF